MSEIKRVGEAAPDSDAAVAHGAHGAHSASAPGVPSALGIPASAAAPEIDGDWPTLSLLSRRYIDRALQFTQGNKTRAADLLGIDRRTLNRIMARDRARRAKPALKPAVAAE